MKSGRHIILTLLLLLNWANTLWANNEVRTDTTLIATSFESNDFPAYASGPINGQNGWQVMNGDGNISIISDYIFDGTQGLNIVAQNSQLRLQNTFFNGYESGLGDIVYFDFRLKILSSTGDEFSINGYDLFGGSLKRMFVIDFTMPEGGTGNVRIYDGWQAIVIGDYQTGEWVRISGRVDCNNSTYSVLLNNSNETAVNFREDYTPIAYGNRPAGIKEFHQLLFNLSTMTSIGNVDIGLDSLYIGTYPPLGVTFSDIELTWDINVEQPNIGSIIIFPDLPEYPDSTEVTVMIDLPQGYQLEQWTGDLSGNSDSLVFTITSNMQIGAQVEIDSTAPPAPYTIVIQEPDTGAIILTPDQPTYHSHSWVEAEINLPIGFEFQGWIGDLNGTDPVQDFQILSDMTIGAIITPDTSEPEIIEVNTCNQLQDALSSVGSGDIIEVMDGTYNCALSLSLQGMEGSPIIIRAQNRGGAVLAGESYMDLENCSHIIIEGFQFTGSPYTAIKLQACSYVRITRNTFRLTEEGSSKWILIGGIWDNPNAASHHNRIDHNLFDEKHNTGNYITIDGQDDPIYQISQYDRIDSNYFRNIGPRHTNEMETIRVGSSDLSLSSGFTKIEYNLFENCDGDPEIISVKSCDNTVRFNTIRSSQGTVSLRHGHRNTVESNFFFGDGKPGTGGVRMYGDDHRVINNYFYQLEGYNWDAPITLTNGDYDGGSNLTAHWRINRALIAFNTLVDNYSNIEIGFTNNGNYSLVPRDVTIANNIVWGSTGQLVNQISTPINLTWQGNIMYPDSIAVLGINLDESQIWEVDPNLYFADSLWKISAASPAVDYSSGNYPAIINDIDGQIRDSNPDAGADELSSDTVTIRPLTSADVGPNGGSDFLAVSDINNDKNRQSQSFLLISAYPNPFNPITTLRYDLPENIRVNIIIYDMLGREVRTLVNQTQNAGFKSIIWDATNNYGKPVSAGVYLYQIQVGDFVQTKKMVLLK